MVSSDQTLLTKMLPLKFWPRCVQTKNLSLVYAMTNREPPSSVVRAAKLDAMCTLSR